MPPPHRAWTLFCPSPSTCRLSLTRYTQLQRPSPLGASMMTVRSDRARLSDPAIPREAYLLYARQGIHIQGPPLCVVPFQLPATNIPSHYPWLRLSLCCASLHLAASPVTCDCTSEVQVATTHHTSFASRALPCHLISSSLKSRITSTPIQYPKTHPFALIEIDFN